jgi:AraC-like DNA-binding protein
MVWTMNVHDSDAGRIPVIAKSRNLPSGASSPRHAHPMTAQLLYAVEGVMMVSTEAGEWIVPPTRAIWVPCGTEHRSRMLTAVRLRTLHISARVAEDLPKDPCVLAVSPLLRELILAAMDIPPGYSSESRDGRVMALLLDEIHRLPSLPLALPLPASADLREVCERLRETPEDATTVEEWARRLAIDPRTLQRRFARETGLSLARWRRQARLIAALEQLALGRRIIDVALDLGYESPTAFSAMFKRELGSSPSNFKKSST